MYELLKSLCLERGINVTELCKQVTGNSGNLATWKKGYMRSDYLKKAAEILNVSADYLLGRTEQKNVSMNNGSVINSGSNNNIQNGNNNNMNTYSERQSTIDLNNMVVAQTYNGLAETNQLAVQMYILETAEKAEK